MTITSQTLTTVVTINTPGPRGPQGLPGPSGSVDTGSLVTTSSFFNFTSSFNTGSFSGSFTGSLLGTATTSSYHALGLQAISGNGTSNLGFVREDSTTIAIVVNNVSSSVSASYAESSSYGLVSIGGTNSSNLVFNREDGSNIAIVVNNVTSASYAGTSSISTSSSYAESSSYSVSSSYALSSSYSVSSSYALSSSYSVSSSYSPNIRPYTTYTALVSQASNNPPTYTILEDTLDHGGLTWGFTGDGEYTLTASKPTFTSNKTFVNSIGVDTASPGNWLYWIRTSDTVITFYSKTNGAGANDLYTNTPVEIRVYN